MFQVIHCADSFVELPLLPDGAVDITITDPPFDAHCQANQCSGTAVKKWVEGEIKSSGIPKKVLDFEPLANYDFARHIPRVSRRWGLVFGADRACGEIARAVGDSWVKGGVWFKPNAQGQMTGDRPASACEYIAITHRAGGKRWNGKGSYGFWACNGTRGEVDKHANQKPLRLCIDLVLKFSEPGELIFDPFCGSGRVGEAALLCGRPFIGWDASAEWCEKAHARLTHAARRFGILADAPVNLCRFKRGELIGVDGILFDPEVVKKGRKRKVTA
jgi:site-specific DNA-methyltransferase (adenine-specific)